MKKIIALLVCIISTGLIMYSCNKSKDLDSTTDAKVNNKEKILFTRSKAQLSPVNAEGIFSDKIQEIKAIDINNSKLSQVKLSDEWKAISSKYIIDASNVQLATPIGSSNIEMIKIPLKGKTEEQNDLLIFHYKGKSILTKLNSKKIINGNRKYSLESTDGKVYFQFEINSQDKIGKAKLVENIPFKEVFGLSTSTKMSVAGIETNPCGGPRDDWYACMNCLLVQKCGSDWICVAACSIDLVLCIGASAIMCVTGGSGT